MKIRLVELRCKDSLQNCLIEDLLLVDRILESPTPQKVDIYLIGLIIDSALLSSYFGDGSAAFTSTLVR